MNNVIRMRSGERQSDTAAQPAPTDREGRRGRVLLFAVVAVGITLRVWHSKWGLPEIYEEATPFNIAWGFWNFGSPGFDFNPHFFNYPALTFYLHFLLQAAQFLIGHLSGAYPTLDSFHQSYLDDPSTFMYCARLLGTAFDVGTILVIYSLGKEWIGEAGALVAALLIAVNPFLIEQTHFVTVDSSVTFFCSLTVLCAVRMYNKPSSGSYCLAGISAGCAAASKYTGAIVLASLIASHFLQSKSSGEMFAVRKSIKVLTALAIASGVFLLCNPFIVLSGKEFRADFGFEQAHMASGHLGVNSSSNGLFYYLFESLPDGMGWVAVVIVFLSVARLIYERSKRDLVILLFPILYLGVICTWKMRADRYLLPALPLLALIAAAGIDGVRQTLVRFGVTALRKPMFNSFSMRAGIGAVMVALLLWEPVTATLRYHRRYSLPDTRAEAQQWIRRNVPSGSSIASIPFGVESLKKNYRLFTIPFDPYNPESTFPFYDLRWYDDIDLLIVSDYDNGRYVTDSLRYRPFLDFYQSVRRNYDRVFEVASSADRTGPAIRLYRNARPVHDMKFDSLLFHRLTAEAESTRVTSFIKGLSNILVGKRRMEKVEQLARFILQREPGDPDAHKQMAIILYDCGKYSEVLDAAKMYLRLAGPDADISALQGDACLRLNNLTDAESHLKAALQMNPTLELAYSDLYEIYRRRNDRSSAIALLTAYRRRYPPESQRGKAIDSEIQKLQSGK